jgi:membrane protease YdiL (CAAX protease family)
MDSNRNSWALVLFFILAFLLHIAAGLLCRVVPIVYLQILLPWTPNITAILLVVFFLKEKAGVQKLINGWKKWKADPRWYLLAFSPIIISFLSAGIYLAFGGTPKGPDPDPPLGLFFPIFAMMAVFTGATGEELGWRGFALPRLQKQFSALISSLLLGIYWGIWHIPTWIIFGVPFTFESTILFVSTTVLNSIILTSIYNNTKGSILLVSLHHWFENIWSSFVVSYLGLISWQALNWIKTPITALLAILLIIHLGPERLSKGEPEGSIKLGRGLEND